MKIYYIIGSTTTTKTSGTGVIHCFEFDVHFTFYKKRKNQYEKRAYMTDTQNSRFPTVNDTVYYFNNDQRKREDANSS